MAETESGPQTGFQSYNMPHPSYPLSSANQIISFNFAEQGKQFPYE